MTKKNIDAKIFKGKLEYFWETGMDKVKVEVNDPTKGGDYDGIIGNNDFLRIFDKKDKRRVIWKGFVKIVNKWVPSKLPGFSHIKTTLDRPDGIPMKLWKKYLNDGYPAELTKATAFASKKPK